MESHLYPHIPTDSNQLRHFRKGQSVCSLWCDLKLYEKHPFHMNSKFILVEHTWPLGKLSSTDQYVHDISVFLFRLSHNAGNTFCVNCANRVQRIRRSKTRYPPLCSLLGSYIMHQLCAHNHRFSLGLSRWQRANQQHILYAYIYACVFVLVSSSEKVTNSSVHNLLCLSLNSLPRILPI